MLCNVTVNMRFVYKNAQCSYTLCDIQYGGQSSEWTTEKFPAVTAYNHCHIIVVYLLKVKVILTFKY